jgi:hypothetical protein
VIQRIQISSNDPMKLSDQILAGAGSSGLRSPLPKWFPADEIDLYTRVSVHGIDLSVQVGFEELLDIPVVLWAHASPVYLWLPKVKLEQQALQVLRGILAEKYAELSEKWGAARLKADPGDIVQLPPIAFEVLSKAGKLEELPVVALDIRDKYSSVRKRFADLDDYLASKDVSPQKKLMEKEKLQKSFADLCKTTKADAVTAFTSLLCRLPEILDPAGVPEASQQPWKAIDWQKVAERVADSLASGMRRMHVRPLYATRKRYLATPSRAMVDAMRRHFGHELTRQDLELARRYAALVKRIRYAEDPWKVVQEN